MSRHTLTMIANSLQVQVVIGWDRPLQSFFANVHVVNPSGEPAGEMIYSKTASPDSPELDLEALRAIGIELPQVLLNNVSRDARDNAGNMIYAYSTENGGVSFTVIGKDP